VLIMSWYFSALQYSGKDRVSQPYTMSSKLLAVAMTAEGRGT
jgi:hypothetical protein